MRIVRGVVSVGMLVGALLLPVADAAAALRGAASRGAARSAAAARREAAPVLRRDLARDRATPVRRLARERTVFRYTTRDRARVERRTGLRPGAHMTARAVRGRPPSALHAQRRYGLPARPQVRETIRLPQGHPVRPNKALSGGRGVGELSSPARVAPDAVKKVVPLPSGKR